MTTSRIALIAAATSLVAWIAKATAVAAAGGPGRTSWEDTLFFVGLATQLIAFVAVVLSLTGSRPVVVRLGALLGGAVLVFGLVTVLQLVIERVQPADASWVWGEINLWVVASLLLGLAVLAHQRATSHTVPAAPLHHQPA
ncbi:hypothetical protein [Ornithinimicrobium cryptoxanthini]|uniref:Uncharacterized protein n=1 Tax=Ornithinimicrobium cryptoxanthini TaxID=2934161 RepID=A0ABY4YFP1_9MICO|nr:hypothetical protein [Ornithinimicrobium cryptoxanthini]USQ75596.1 hypothetical protein NF557_13385 [Ornithinimicrobium cryptoxanthini]